MDTKPNIANGYEQRKIIYKGIAIARTIDQRLQRVLGEKKTLSCRQNSIYWTHSPAMLLNWQHNKFPNVLVSGCANHYMAFSQNNLSFRSNPQFLHTWVFQLHRRRIPRHFVLGIPPFMDFFGSTNMFVPFPGTIAIGETGEVNLTAAASKWGTLNPLKQHIRIC